MKKLNRRSRKKLEDDLHLSFYAFKTNIIDKDDFTKNYLIKSKRLQKFIKENSQKEDSIPFAENVALDLFSAYSRYYIKFLPKNDIHSDYLLNYFAIKEVTKSEDFKQIRQYSRKDKFMSLLSVEIILEPFLEAIEKLKKKHYNLQQLVDELRKACENREDPSEEDKVQLREEVEKLSGDFTSDLKKEMRDTTQSAIETIGSLVKTGDDFGLSSDGKFSRLPYEEKIKTLKELRGNKKIKEVSLLAGRLKAIYRKGRKSWTDEGMDSIRGVQKGDDLSSTLTGELAYISNSKYKKLFYKKMADKDLANYSYGSKKTKGRGPITALVDTSMSMSGQKEVYSKATLMALLEVCRKQKRPMVVIFFDSGLSAKDLHTVRFQKSDLNNPKKLIDMITYFGGNGTMFKPPLERAKREINSSKIMKKSDIVFITDGESYLEDSYVEDYNNWRALHRIRMYVIHIGSSLKQDHLLYKLGDKINSLTNLKTQTNNVSKELFRHLDLE